MATEEIESHIAVGIKEFLPKHQSTDVLFAYVSVWHS